MRRIVTGHNDNGKSVIKIDGPPARSIGEEIGGNGIELGRRQDGTALNHVALPRWARGSPWKLGRTLRKALESPFVGRELPGWIDAN